MNSYSTTPAPVQSSKEKMFELIYSKARLAGLEAGNKADVMPMIVEEHANMLDDSSPVKKSYFVEGGVCGFAWVKIRPANSAFAHWMVENDHARADSYAGGINHWVSDFGQSMARKEDYAHAFALVLQAAGIKAHSQSRID